MTDDSVGDLVCAVTYCNKSEFKVHLREYHDIKSKEHMNAKLRSQHIGSNGQGQFWCGFCRKIVKLQYIGLKAWDERFNHIGDHYSAQNLTVQDWLPPKGRYTKGEIESIKPKRRYSETADIHIENIDDIVVEDEDEDDSSLNVPSGEVDTDMEQRSDIDLTSFDSSTMRYLPTSEFAEAGYREGSRDDISEPGKADWVFCVS